MIKDNEVYNHSLVPLAARTLESLSETSTELTYTIGVNKLLNMIFSPSIHHHILLLLLFMIKK